MNFAQHNKEVMRQSKRKGVMAWQMKSGEMILVTDMTDTHLANTAAMLRRLIQQDRDRAERDMVHEQERAATLDAAKKIERLWHIEKELVSRGTGYEADLRFRGEAYPFEPNSFEAFELMHRFPFPMASNRRPH